MDELITVDIVIAVAMFWHLAAVTRRQKSSLFGEIILLYMAKNDFLNQLV